MSRPANEAANPHVFAVGERVSYTDGVLYEVTSVMPRLTRYDHAGQYTKVEGYTYGMKAVRLIDDEEDPD